MTAAGVTLAVCSRRDSLARPAPPERRTPPLARRRPARIRLPDPPGEQLRSTRDISHAPVDPNSAQYIASIGAQRASAPRLRDQPRLRHPLHGRRPRVSRRCRSRSPNTAKNPNPGPYPVPPNAPVEGAGEEGDRHVLVLQRGSCKLYELYARTPQRRRLGSGLGRGVRPAQQRAAPRRLDLGRRRRPADLPAARALPGGARRADRPRAARDRGSARSAATSTRPPTSPPAAPTRACRRWGCGCA